MSLNGPNMECVQGEARPFQYDPVSQHNSLVFRLVKFGKDDSGIDSETSSKSGMASMGTIQENEETNTVTKITSIFYSATDIQYVVFTVGIT
jgi:hypothetical protein